MQIFTKYWGYSILLCVSNINDGTHVNSWMFPWKLYENLKINLFKMMAGCRRNVELPIHVSLSFQYYIKSQSYKLVIDKKTYELNLMTLLSATSRSSVDRAPARCSGGHGFESYQGLDRIFTLSHALALLINAPFTNIMYVLCSLFLNIAVPLRLRPSWS